MELLEQLKRDEGLRLKPYVDTVGKVTIGYGTNLTDGIDQGEAEYLLSNRLNQKRLELLAALPWVADLTKRDAAYFSIWPTTWAFPAS
jgi:lysozyme